MPTEEAVAPSDAAGDNAPEVTASATTATAEAAPKRRKGSARATAKAAASSNKSGAKPQHNHPPYGSMIKAALLASEDKKGSSRAAILKYIMQNYEVGENASLVNSHLRMGLKRGVTSGALKQVKGTGASGSFRLADAKTEPAKAVKKPMAKKTAAAGDVKMAAATPKKSTRTKSMKKKTVTKAAKPKPSPKKKAPAVAATPKKAAKPVGRPKKGKASPAAKLKSGRGPAHARSKKVAA